jgi:hypothetical protein
MQGFRSTAEAEITDLVYELQEIELHLQAALEKSKRIGRVMVNALIREALDEVQMARNQIPGER